MKKSSLKVALYSQCNNLKKLMFKKSEWTGWFDRPNQEPATCSVQLIIKTALAWDQSNPIKTDRFNRSNCKLVEPCYLIFYIFSLKTSFSLTQIPSASVFFLENQFFIHLHLLMFLGKSTSFFFSGKMTSSFLFLFLFWEKQLVPN